MLENRTPDDELIEALIERGPSSFDETEAASGVLHPLAFHISDSHGVVLAIRKWKDDSLHWETLRYLRHEGFVWELIGRTGSGISSPIRPAGQVEGLDHIRIFGNGGWWELGETGEAVESWREISGIVSELVADLYVSRGAGSPLERIPIFDSGAFAFVGSERYPDSDATLVGETDSETIELPLVSLKETGPLPGSP